MKENLTFSGGARIGWAHASWPLAKLSVSEANLSLSAFALGKYEFAPRDVVSLEAYRSMPLVGRGIRILHSRSDYPEQFIFWSFRNPEILLEDIRAAGFRPGSAATRPHRSGMPVRWSAIMVLVVVWNALFLLDGSVLRNPPKPPGPLVVLAVGIMFVGSIAWRRSAVVQRLVMKPGRSINEVAHVLMLVQVTSGFMLLFLALFSWFGLSP